MASTFDGVVDEQVWARDGWQCQMPVCLSPAGRAFDRELAWPDPWSATVDHIIPLSRGGTDIAPNKRAAHARCNGSRGDRVSPADVQIVTPELAPLGLLPSLAPLGLLPSLRPPQPRKPKLCGACGMQEVWKAGVTCTSCKQAAADGRRDQVLALRERGFSWAEIAEIRELSGPGAAYNVAFPPWYRYKEQPEKERPGPKYREPTKAERREQVLVCREAGMPWAKIAESLGLSGPGAVHKIARAEPALDLENRLWWTTVRPA